MSIDFEDLGQRTIQSQYSSSPHIMGLVESFRQQIDPSKDIAEFFVTFFDPRTAQGVGLDIWGEIVGVSRYLEVDEGEYFGFLNSDLYPFNQQPFVYEAENTKVYKLADNAYRELIFLKAYANIGEATLPALKTVANALFKKATVIDKHDMSVRVLFLTYDIPAYSYAIFKKYGLMTLGAGVDWEYLINVPEETFGLFGSNLQPFNQGVFAPYGIVKP
jgi:hypothetical protein